MRPYVPGKPIDDVKRELGLSDVIKLASNENPLGCSKKAKDAVAKTLTNPALYPDGNCTKLRNLLSEKLSVSPEQLIFGAGSDEIITMLTQVFVEPEDEVITGTPSFPRYRSAVQLMGGNFIEVPLKNHTFDLDSIANAVTQKTKMIIVANPNNPTGTIFNAAQQAAFLEKIPSNVLVVLDEAYYEYVEDPAYPESIPLLKQYDNIIILRTFSKIYGLASLRVGYGVSTPAIIGLLNRVRGPFNVSTAAQEAAYASLLDEEFKTLSFLSNQKAKAYFYEALNEIELSYIPTRGNFIMIDTKKHSKDMFEQLQQKGFIVRPGFYFGMDTYIRVTIGTMEESKQFIEALKQLI
jgi:histidinol-phosphate aminotransferase